MIGYGYDIRFKNRIGLTLSLMVMHQRYFLYQNSPRPQLFYLGEDREQGAGVVLRDVA
jgi:hypothetical protein